MQAPPEVRGSQRWIRAAVNEYPHVLQAPLAAAMRLPSDATITWVSPLDSEKHREYRDEEALRRLLRLLDLPESLKAPLKEFWPRRGPVWDALGVTRRGDLLLVEAKAHVAELASPATRATPASRALIERSLTATRDFLAPGSEAAWSGTFYQYANRLAHLYLLRHRNGLPAHLVFVYFLNAADVDGPSTKAEWDAALTLLYAALGLSRRHPLSAYVHNVFIDAASLADAGANQ